MGVGFLSDNVTRIDDLGPGDVVILPAFGVTVKTLQQLEARGCTLVDTTCGSVLNVWKNVRRYAESGFTSVIHGKVWHEETQATASQALTYGGAYLVVFDRGDAALVGESVRGRATSKELMNRVGRSASPGFDPDRDLQRIGLANQTTMLMSESLEIGEMLKAAFGERHGAALDAHFQAFDTICSATQDRQDAVVTLLKERPVDLMIVIGGYNSSNTCNLARMCAERLPTFHIAGSDCLESARDIRHKPVGVSEEVVTRDYLPLKPRVVLGLTAGASTPDIIVGAVIERLAGFCRGRG